MRSMTGFGEACVESGDSYVRVEISSVNRRHTRIKLNYDQPALKEKVIKKVRESIDRGSVEIHCESNILGREKEIPTINRDLLDRYLNSLRELSQNIEEVPDQVNGIDLLNLPGVVEVHTEQAHSEKGEKLLLEAVDKALEEVLKMRDKEGEEIAADLKEWIENIRNYVKQIKERVPGAIKRYREKLLDSIESILELTGEEKQERLEKELKNYAEKCDISEEISRIYSHLKQFDEYLRASGPVGKNLEFLLQELQREINTVGAKANDAEISQLSVKIKSELEKCREQVKNLE